MDKPIIAEINGFGVTDIGCCRSENEDQYLMSGFVEPKMAEHDLDRDSHTLVSNRLALLAVADGVGGHQAGSTASATAVEALGRYAQENELVFRHSEAIWELANLVRNGILEADVAINALASSDLSRYGMGTTLTAALVRYPNLVVGHVGDSRCYLYRAGKLTRLTTDHTMAELYRELGELTGEEAESSPMNNVLWNCLGTNKHLSTEIETHIVDLEPDDWILLATDGLTAHVSEQEIQSEIAKAKCPRVLGNNLKCLAIDRGGKDNVTIIACKWCVRLDHKQSQNANRSHSAPDFRNGDVRFGEFDPTDYV